MKFAGYSYGWRPQRRISSIVVVTLALGLGSAGAIVTAETLRHDDPVVIKNQGFLPFADSPINYRSSELNDPVARLEKRLERGQLKLHYHPRHGYLKSALHAVH